MASHAVEIEDTSICVFLLMHSVSYRIFNHQRWDRPDLEYLQHLLQLRAGLLYKNSFVRFCLVGSFGVLVDMLTLYVLSDPSTLHWGLTRSKIIGAELALISNFLMHDAWTFAARIGANRGIRAKLQRFLKFNALCGLGLILNIGILNILFNRVGLNRYAANAIAIVLVTVWNYTLNLKLGWRIVSVDIEPRRRLRRLS
jgi:dolichol-phosphate mannosyltransferase